MNLVRNLTAFSCNGDLLAYSSPDGCLKVWETSTKLLKQEYTPSSHLSATCSSLAWGPFVNDERTVKKSKKSDKTTDSRILNLKLLAMGTMTGDILLYSYTNADLYTCLRNGHSSTVNDIAWFKNDLYSCSNDQHIIIWDITSNIIKTKWKANSGPIYSICVANENNILTASNSIQLWDVKQKSVIKVFIGHGTEIFKLILVNIMEQNLNQYVLSAAVDDRVINAWQLGEKSSKNSVVSFVLSDKPANVDVLIQKNEPLRVSAVSEDGTLNFFEHTLNEKSKKPLHPKFSIQIASKGSDGQKSHQLPILASNISSGLDSCLLTYGSFLKPAFERIDISDVSNDLFLIKCVTESSYTEKDVLRIKQAEKPNNVKLLAPGHMTDVSFSESSARKRKQEKLDIKELPMEERLKALDLSRTPKEMSEEDSTIKSNSMIHLLLQGLQSNDNNMLNTVLLNGDDIIIKNTIERLPIQSVFPLLKVLYERLNKREPKNHPCLKWFTALITTHIAYFMSCKDISDYLIPFDQLFAARKETVCKMSQAQGILKLLLMQAMSSSSISSEIPSKPLLEYESESSEASDIEADNSDEELKEEVTQDASSDESSESSDSDSESEMED